MQKVKCGHNKGQAVNRIVFTLSDSCQRFFEEIIEEDELSRTQAVKLAMEKFGLAHKSTEMIYGRAKVMVTENRAYRISLGLQQEINNMRRRKFQAQYKGRDRESFKFKADTVGVKPYAGRPAEKAQMIKEYNELRERRNNEDGNN